jgi:hypothetical protein
MRWQTSAPLGPQASRGMHEQPRELASHVFARVAQCAGPRMGIWTQPPLELPMQNELNIVPGGHAPASSRGTHWGAGPQRLVDGWTQNWSGPQVAPPQPRGASDRTSEAASIVRESEPASTMHAHPRPRDCHLPSIPHVYAPPQQGLLP